MDTSQIKKYAIQARRDFIAAVTARAKRIGAGPNGIEDYQVRGDFLIIGEQTFPRAYKEAFSQLSQLIAQKGFDQFIDEVAYTWFNRFIALRYMEIQDYLPHGLRVLSSKDSNPSPEIMKNPLHLDFSVGINKAQIKELFEAGNREEELYRTLLIAQCNELHSIMPFLFEKVSHLSELLLPDGLLASDSIIRSLATEIDEAEWQKGVEIIGWIYQFYISEKKDEVIGKVVNSQDIPAATQLFTPNWIVKYLVENSVGSYWLGTYPESPLVSKMEYYIRPAKQEPEVEEELKRITPKEINPESITVIDPACGSGHILVEAYNLLKEIYLERGYRPKDIPKLILEKNLFGLDIDTRAAQLAALALLLRARADDRSIFSTDHPVQLNIREILAPDFKIEEAVQCLTQGKNIAVHQLSMPCADTSRQATLGLSQAEVLTPQDVRDFFELFIEAKTFGALIQIPEHLRGKISTIEKQAEKAAQSSNIFERPIASKILDIVKQAQLLAEEYDACVMNPPYMGAKYLTPKLKAFVKDNFAGYEKDLFSSFIVRALSYTKHNGHLGFMSPFVWMFITSFEQLRGLLIKEKVLSTLIQLEYSGFDGATVPICAFTVRNLRLPSFRGSYVRLADFRGAENQGPKTLEAIRDRSCGWFFTCVQTDLTSIPGSPIAYWVNDKVRKAFARGITFKEVANPRVGMQTANNAQYLRAWYEIPANEFLDEPKTNKWIKYIKGGAFRRWYGNLFYLLRYNGNPEYILRQENATVLPISCLSQPKCTWTDLTSSKFNCRIAPPDSFHDISGHCFYPTPSEQLFFLGYANTKLFNYFLSLLNSSFHYQVGDVGRVPVLSVQDKPRVIAIVSELVEISKSDWDSSETSWDFHRLPFLMSPSIGVGVEESIHRYSSECISRIRRTQELEEENNSLFIEGYGLASEFTSEVPENEISLYRPDPTKDIQALMSYSIGCMMGRYSLDAPGLTYANSGNLAFDLSKYKKFPTDSDGIIPLMDHPWFEDDATTRFISFLKVAWSEDKLSENLKFVAESLRTKNGETPEETIQRYLSDGFYKDHLKTYKKRPIYWLFSSGKESAFQALVYLHRYNESTLSKMRTDYVLPLQGKMANEQRRLESQIDSASSPSEKNRCRKELEKLKKKSIELKGFDEKLHHLADQRISLDLDDGVKVNYSKLASLLAGVKEVTGGSDE